MFSTLWEPTVIFHTVVEDFVLNPGNRSVQSPVYHWRAFWVWWTLKSTEAAWVAQSQEVSKPVGTG